MRVSGGNSTTEGHSSFSCYPNSFGGPLLESGEYFDWSPSFDVSETPHEFLIRAALPTVKREDLRVTCEHGLLTLSGECRPSEDRQEDRNFRDYSGTFSRSFALPDAIDAAAIAAEFTDEVLTLHVPKADSETGGQQ